VWAPCQGWIHQQAEPSGRPTATSGACGAQAGPSAPQISAPSPPWKQGCGTHAHGLQAADGLANNTRAAAQQGVSARTHANEGKQWSGVFSGSPHVPSFSTNSVTLSCDVMVWLAVLRTTRQYGRRDQSPSSTSIVALRGIVHACRHCQVMCGPAHSFESTATGCLSKRVPSWLCARKLTRARFSSGVIRSSRRWGKSWGKTCDEIYRAFPPAFNRRSRVASARE